MCGIAGVLYRDPERKPEAEVLRAMGRAIAHRGPDDEGVFLEPGIGLVHRRLAIIDIKRGRQPMANEDGSVVVITNGEIYNYQRLRAGLEFKGHTFRTKSDTEVLVHLYEEDGEKLVDRLRGMFAFAIWDRRQRRLMLARDRVGLKPLYIYRDAKKLVFGSELKAILAHPEIDRTIDPAAIDDYITFGMVSGSRSIFRRIQKLPPAHVVSVSADSLDASARRYWRLQIEPDERFTIAQWQEALQAKITETVQSHQIADVPVGAFLSGGLDSSVMVAVQSEVSNRAVRTFSIGFREARFSELSYARQVSEYYDTSHHESIVTPEAVGALDDLVRYYDEPFADSSALPTLWVSRLASKSVKVVLSGDGGDEALGGYTRYVHDLREAWLRRWIPRLPRQSILGPLGRIWPRLDWLPRPLRAKTLLTNLSLDAAEAYANTLSICRPAMRRQILSPDLLAQIDGNYPEQYVIDAFQTAPSGDPLAGMIAADVNTILPDDFLTKVDRASMACGLEVRPPLVDHELLELAARIPSKYKIRRGNTKWLLKHTYQKRLPEGLAWRKKQGFEIPIDAWLRGPLGDLFETAVLNSNGPIRDWIDKRAVDRMFGHHISHFGRHGNLLWSLLVLARWADCYLGAKPS